MMVSQELQLQVLPSPDEPKFDARGGVLFVNWEKIPLPEVGDLSNRRSCPAYCTCTILPTDGTPFRLRRKRR